MNFKWLISHLLVNPLLFLLGPILLSVSDNSWRAEVSKRNDGLFLTVCNKLKILGKNEIRGRKILINGNAVISGANLFF